MYEAYIFRPTTQSPQPQTLEAHRVPISHHQISAEINKLGSEYYVLDSLMELEPTEQKVICDYFNNHNADIVAIKRQNNCTLVLTNANGTERKKEAERMPSSVVTQPVFNGKPVNGNTAPGFAAHAGTPSAFARSTWGYFGGHRNQASSPSPANVASGSRQPSVEDGEINDDDHGSQD